MFATRKVIAEIFSTVIAMPAVYRGKSIHQWAPYLKAIFKSLKMQNIFPMFIATSDIDHDKQLGQIVVAWNGKGLLVSQPSRFDRTDALVI